MKTELVVTLKRHATRLLSDFRESGEPVLITEHGKPAAYLVDVDSYEYMHQWLGILEGIALDERALLEVRTYSQAEAWDKLKKWLVKKVFERVERLERFPNSGRRPAELADTPYRKVLVPPRTAKSLHFTVTHDSDQGH